jgi:iron complex outermembrane receptor protein
MTIRRRAAASASSFILLALAPATAAIAAEAGRGDAELAGASGGLTEIVVTAQKRPENLQTTPISVTVMRDEDIAHRHVTPLVDLGDGAIPSLKVAPFYSRNSAPRRPALDQRHEAWPADDRERAGACRSLRRFARAL